ncbi:MAG TPA: hypothetical protein VIT91_04575 [Chthoniobacterales bacterium]
MPATAELIEAIPIILSLILIEGLLSVDNALAIAAMASHLPEKQQKLALRLGIVGAYTFRGLCLVFVAWIQHNLWIKYFGAGYLIYLMCSHLTQSGHHEEGHKSMKGKGLWMTVCSIELMDLSLSIDNVIAAVALSNKLWVIITGVFLGILTLRLLAGYAIGLIKKFPVLGSTAFLLVGYVGFLLLFELITHIHLGAFGKFAGILAITFATIWYSKSAVLQKMFGPFVRATLVPMRWFSQSVGLLTWPITFLISKMRPTAS